MRRLPRHSPRTKHYTVEFENDTIRLLRVRIGAGESAPAHAHPAYCAIEILTDHFQGVNRRAG